MYSGPSGDFTGAKEWAFLLSELIAHAAESEVVGTSNNVLGNSSPLTPSRQLGCLPWSPLLAQLFYLKKNGKGERRTEKEAASKEGSSSNYHFLSTLAFFLPHSLPPFASVENK